MPYSGCWYRSPHTQTEYDPLTPENIYKCYLIKNRTNCADCHVQDKTGHIYLPATYFRVPFIPLSLCFTIPVPPKPPWYFPFPTFGSSAKQPQISVAEYQNIFTMYPIMGLISPLHSKDAPESCCRWFRLLQPMGLEGPLRQPQKGTGWGLCLWLDSLASPFAVVPLYCFLCMEEPLIGCWLSCSSHLIGQGRVLFCVLTCPFFSVLLCLCEGQLFINIA